MAVGCGPLYFLVILKTFMLLCPTLGSEIHVASGLQPIDPIGQTLMNGSQQDKSDYHLEVLARLVQNTSDSDTWRIRRARRSRTELSNGSGCKQYLVHILILLSYDIEVNPGPRQWKYPCGSCLKPVKSNQKGIFCDQCDIWWHLACVPEVTHVNEEEYLTMMDNNKDWYCYSCQLPSFSNSFFDTDRSEVVTSDSDNGDSLATDLDINFDSITCDYPKGFMAAYLNINSLRHKIIHIREALKRTPVDILGIAESKLDNSFLDAQFQIDGYIMFRRDRDEYGGGLMVYIRSDIPCRRLTKYETASVELLALEVLPQHNNKQSKWL